MGSWKRDTGAPSALTPALAKLGEMVIEQLQNSGGAIRQIQDSMGAVEGPYATATQRVSMSNSMGAVQGPYETTTRCVSMSNSGGAVQSSKEVKPKGNMRDKLKVPQPEPTRYGTRQMRSVERLEL